MKNHAQSTGVQYLSLCATDMDNGQFIQILRLWNKIIYGLVVFFCVVNQAKAVAFNVIICTKSPVLFNSFRMTSCMLSHDQLHATFRRTKL